MNPYELISFATAGALAKTAAGAWLDEIETAQIAGRPHHVALSGGRIAQQFFSSFVEQAAQRKISLARVHFFWADERLVPPTDDESNYRIARELLFEPLQISAGQIHRIRGEDLPEASARAAEEDLRRIVRENENGQPVLDLVFLGLGEDGHVASLFPGESPALLESKRVYRAIANSNKPPPRRVTLGYSSIAAAEQVWMLASGLDKTAALYESLSPDGKTPFARVLQTRSYTKIFTDIPLK